MKKPSQPCSSAATARFTSRAGSPNGPTFGTPIAYRGIGLMGVTLGPGGHAARGGPPVIASQGAGLPGYAAGMLPTGHLLAFALLSFVLIIVPGPNVIFVITRSLMLGRADGVSTAVGGQIGVYAQVAAVALGIGALVERSVTLFTAIKLAGAGYLVYLGIQGIRHRRSLRNALNGVAQPKGIGRILR